MITVVILFAAREQDRLSAELSQRQVGSALAELAGSSARIALDYGWWDEAYAMIAVNRDQAWADENIGNWLGRTAGLAAAFAVEPGAGQLFVWPNGRATDFAAYDAIVGAVLRDGAAVPTPITGYVNDGGRLMMVAASPLRPVNPAPVRQAVLVMAWDVPGHVLPRLRRITQNPDLAVGGDGPVHLAIDGAWGGYDWWMSWPADNHGEAFLKLVLPTAAGAFAVMSALAWWLWWRSSRNWARARWLEESRTRMLAAIGHDLRQPLQSLALFSAVLDTCVQEPRAREILGKLDGSIDRMGQLLAAILNLARLDMGDGELGREPVPLGPLLDAVAEEMRPQAESKGLNFRVMPTSLHIESCSPLLLTMLRNLVANAIRYTESGSVLLGCRRHGSRVEIWVCDTGIGIPLAKQPLVFEEFFQVANAERDATKGFGLGLAIVQRLCRSLGHSISLRSAEGRGSVFIVSGRLAQEQ